MMNEYRIDYLEMIDMEEAEPDMLATTISASSAREAEIKVTEKFAEMGIEIMVYNITKVSYIKARKRRK